MLANFLLGAISLLLACSPYLSQLGALMNPAFLAGGGNIRGSFELVVAALGLAGLVFALFNSFVKRKSGSPYIVLGTLVIVVGFFYNEETLPMPLSNALLGGELFFAFVTSFALAVAGLLVEWLTQDLE